MVEKKSHEETPLKERESRISRKEAERKGRKTVVILLVITIFLSLFFWLKKELPRLWQEIFGSYKMVIEKK